MDGKISEAEQVVMEVLWAAHPLTAQAIADRVPPGRSWSLNTVRTLLARLTAKNAIAFEADGRRYLYRPLVARADYVAGESDRLIDRFFGGRLSPFVAHLAERKALDADEIAEIEAMLKAMKS